ncbi:TPM domain-containing protein [Methylobacterium gnaphalii]|uniref:TPM domain-containing protein n=1 Tax=Methylobacterium gnaphalii TaxID=1010610 RepID=A0A512JEH4_9HYPH|nr:YgcG family protein [Methylobacterium gnaphalii]GEP08339.1 hypothetical protein MGN01_01840 [Methylobacterium gnaphalii]GJD67885.1 hypothetical protein MMMDOFMJ_0803 [Methylobacterium gnaphalii]GLS51030.1 hypothetical protein GCM10007885_38840 [Methylobacterium gnaphalii]
MAARRHATGRLRRLAVGPICVLLLMACVGLVRAAEPSFPALDGRVTDAAGVLPQDVRERITAKLKAQEDKSGDQIVVATVPSLQGLTVEDYANRLYREWKLGQAKQNNGALLLVAPNERKVRIEAGYGVEGALTDAVSKVIITTAITPKFKQGDLPGGIEAGADAILSVLAGDAEQWQRRAPVRRDSVNGLEVAFWIVLILFVVIAVWRMNSGSGPGGRHRRRGGDIIIFPSPSSGGWSGGFSGGGGGFSDSGFSGGGGSSGGGGASGDW